MAKTYCKVSGTAYAVGEPCLVQISNTLRIYTSENVMWFAIHYVPILTGSLIAL